MNTKEEIPKTILAPYIPINTGTIINGIRVSDYRWWVNIWCKINWFFHFKERKRWKKIANMKVDPNLYANSERIIFHNDTNKKAK